MPGSLFHAMSCAIAADLEATTSAGVDHKYLANAFKTTAGRPEFSSTGCGLEIATRKKSKGS
eukprot:3551346-Amphidinium_carterae.1